MQSLVVLLGQSAAVHVPTVAAVVTSGRAQALLALVIGLLSAVVGGVSLVRSRAAEKGRAGPAFALSAGALGAVLAALRIASSGAIGTGGGRLGAIVALVLALCGIALGGLALARRARRDPPARRSE